MALASLADVEEELKKYVKTEDLNNSIENAKTQINAKMLLHQRMSGSQLDQMDERIKAAFESYLNQHCTTVLGDLHQRMTDKL